MVVPGKCSESVALVPGSRQRTSGSLPRHLRPSVGQHSDCHGHGHSDRGQLGGRPRRVPVRQGGLRKRGHRGRALHAPWHGDTHCECPLCLPQMVRDTFTVTAVMGRPQYRRTTTVTPRGVTVTSHDFTASRDHAGIIT